MSSVRSSASPGSARLTTGPVRETLGGMRTPWPALVLAFLTASACSHDCGADENATARSAAGPDLTECGRSYYGNISCDPSAAAAAARQCIVDAAKSCKPAHFWREFPSSDGRVDEDVYVVPRGKGCEIQVVRLVPTQYCPDPVQICTSVSATNWDGPAGKCPFATGLGCTGGFQ